MRRLIHRRIHIHTRRYAHAHLHAHTPLWRRPVSWARTPTAQRCWISCGLPQSQLGVSMCNPRGVALARLGRKAVRGLMVDSTATVYINGAVFPRPPSDPDGGGVGAAVRPAGAASCRGDPVAARLPHMLRRRLGVLLKQARGGPQEPFPCVPRFAASLALNYKTCVAVSSA